METKTIKLWDYISITTDSEVYKVKNFPELWETFGWDIKNDPNAKECADLVVREMYCFGHMDLSAAYGKTLVLDVVRED